jgi:lipopolysaccharide transport system ATP-binding protein
MNDIAIKAELLSKKYKINTKASGSLRETIVNKWHSLSRKSQHLPIDFWALKDISFEVKKGEVLGIIGKNGAGKSTLLKVLSRITEPTHGHFIINGRVSSLLEVGTGFHPELTGRENIYLNGTILGMTRKEVKQKFDEIVDFSGVEKFIDTPVKHYSSGMYVRLAFSVAAHLEPEILIIDEVLSVGDAEFQKKCLGKMKDVAGQGRTVLFVSHNMGAINQLCTHTFLLKNGIIDFMGTPSATIDHYISSAKLSSNIINKESVTNENNQFVIFKMADYKMIEKLDFKFDEQIVLIIELYIPEWNSNLELAISLLEKYKKRIFTIHEKLINYYHGKKTIKLKITIPSSFINPGSYSWITCINFPGNRNYDLHEDIASFVISETGSSFSRYVGVDYGCIVAKYEISQLI